MGMNLLINAARRETRGPKTESGIYLPSSRGFMDDLTLTTATHVQARWMLAALTDVASWGRMKFKAAKSRSLVIKKGQTTERFKLYVQNEEIPSIVANPIKCLGKWFDASLHDRDNVRKLERQVEDGLKKIDRCGLPGKFKAWLYQHALLPRLIWPLMLYEVPSTTVEALERIQPTSQEVAWSPTKFHEHRTLWEDKQTTAPTIFTGRRVQGCQVKTGADSKGFSRRTDP